jgi:hypothetical protein
MNPKQTYLAWVRTAYPSLYWRAVTRTFSPQSGMSGLGDDLTDSITVDPSSVSTSITLPGVDQQTIDAINAANSTTQSNTSTDWFGQLANAITSIAPTVIQTQAAENLLQINSQRAAQGLPPLTANGVPVTGSMLSPTSASVAQMEAALAGGSGSLLLIAGVGLLLLLAAKS